MSTTKIAKKAWILTGGVKNELPCPAGILIQNPCNIRRAGILGVLLRGQVYIRK
jgi:hypothetical protein